MKWRAEIEQDVVVVSAEAEVWLTRPSWYQVFRAQGVDGKDQAVMIVTHSIAG
jgi:hypothetical protein